MFVKSFSILRFRQIEDLQKAADEFPEKITREVNAIVDYYTDRIMADFQYEPEKPAPDPDGKSNSLRWTSRAQQLAFHGTKGFGRGIPTARAERGSRIVDSFSIRFRRNPKSISVRFGYSDHRSVYVFGPIQPEGDDDYAENDEGLFQQEFMNDRGWVRASIKVTHWRIVIRDVFNESLREIVQNLYNREE